MQYILFTAPSLNSSANLPTTPPTNPQPFFLLLENKLASKEYSQNRIKQKQ